LVGLVASGRWLVVSPPAIPKIPPLRLRAFALNSLCQRALATCHLPLTTSH